MDLSSMLNADAPRPEPQRQPSGDYPRQHEQPDFRSPVAQSPYQTSYFPYPTTPQHHQLPQAQQHLPPNYPSPQYPPVHVSPRRESYPAYHISPNHTPTSSHGSFVRESPVSATTPVFPPRSLPMDPPPYPHQSPITQRASLPSRSPSITRTEYIPLHDAPKDRVQSLSRERTASISPKTSQPLLVKTEERIEDHASFPAKLKRESSTLSPRNSVSNPRKRPRYEEPPIFARSVSNRKAVLGRPPPMVANGQAVNGVHRVEASPKPEERAKVEERAKPEERVMREQRPPKLWEPSVTGLIPYEDLTKSVADFLFKEVVSRTDVRDGATLEIEAKLGTLIDRHTNQRIALPVLTECLVGLENSKLAFQSQMTEEQHKQYNDRLNAMLLASRAPGKKRVPMDYVHTYERDSFYDLPDGIAVYNTLPPSVRAQVDPKRSKVRITTDTKTQTEIAKIIKMRLADIHIFSPRTAFDWRVSVSLEMNYDGEMEHLSAQRVSSASDIARNKDRLSYKHLAYQIDLTQVTPHQGKGDKTHELEVEVNSAELRREGNLAREGKENRYEDLVKGFTDNVRVLARAVS